MLSKHLSFRICLAQYEHTQIISTLSSLVMWPIALDILPFSTTKEQHKESWSKKKAAQISDF